MDINIIFTGLVIGFSIAAPVGPIGMPCIRRTLADGRAAGVLSGLGAATADALFGCVAGFGLTFISDFLIGQQFWFRLIGGVFLVYLGVRMFVSKPATHVATAGGKGWLGAYLSTLVLALTNPITILFFAGVFIALGASGMRLDYLSASVLVVGVFVGSAAWWFSLSLIVSLARVWFTPPLMRWVNRASGLIIIGFGAVALWGIRGA